MLFLASYSSSLFNFEYFTKKSKEFRKVLTKLDQFKDFWSKSRICQKCPNFFCFFCHNFWSCEPIFITQKPLYVKNLWKILHLWRRTKRVYPWQHYRAPWAPLNRIFFKPFKFLKTRENLLDTLQISLYLIAAFIFYFWFEKRARIFWSPCKCPFNANFFFLFPAY